MTPSSPIALLLSAASDPSVAVDRLVRAALLVATSLADRKMVAWCSSELNGYEGKATDLPDYRKIASVLMATDAWGRNIPAVIHDPELSDLICQAYLYHGVSELQNMAAVGGDKQYKLLFDGDAAKALRSMFPAAVELFRVIQVVTIAGAVECVRQRVFSWCIDKTEATVSLPKGVNIEGILGIRISDAVRPAIPPMESIDGSGVKIVISELSNSAVVLNSPSGNASVTQSSQVDAEALRSLVVGLREVVENLKSSGVSDRTVASLSEPLQELQALSEMPRPKVEWVKQSLHTLRTVLEQAASSVLGSIATPHITALIAQVLKS